MPRYKSKYSEQKNSEIRYNLLGALHDLTKFNGIDMKTIQSTSPYSLVLNNITSQKLTVEINKLIDYGMVVKGSAKGKTVKYMLRDYYEDLQKTNVIKPEKLGYGDYRDEKENEEETLIKRIKAASLRNRYEDMWE